MVKPWMLDELAHAGPEHLDPGLVAGFDRKQGYPDFADDLAVLAGHGIGPASTLVDLGAGTGRFALAAAPRVGRVVAVDVSPAMQAAVRDRATRAGLANWAAPPTIVAAPQQGSQPHHLTSPGHHPPARPADGPVGMPKISK